MQNRRSRWGGQSGPDILVRMAQRMIHRGLDNNGIWIDARYGWRDPNGIWRALNPELWLNAFDRNTPARHDSHT